MKGKIQIIFKERHLGSMRFKAIKAKHSKQAVVHRTLSGMQDNGTWYGFHTLGVGPLFKAQRKNRGLPADARALDQVDPAAQHKGGANRPRLEKWYDYGVGPPQISFLESFQI